MNKTKEFLKLIGVLLGILVLTGLVGVLIGVLSLDLPNLVIILISQLVFAICAYFLIKRKKRIDGSNYIKDRGFLADSWKMIIIGLGTAGFGNILISLLVVALGDNALVNQSIDMVSNGIAANSPMEKVLQLFILVVLAPIVEEYLFRGYLFTELNKIFKSGLAIFINGLLFGLYHMNLLQGINALFLGMVLALVYYSRKNIKDSILVHMANNGIVMVSTYLIEYASIIGMILIVSIFIGAYILYKIYKDR